MSECQGYNSAKKIFFFFFTFDFKVKYDPGIFYDMGGNE